MSSKTRGSRIDEGDTPVVQSSAPVVHDYIQGFDGLRAIAVLIVLVAHAGYGNLIPGGFGVTIFFSISGYLITTLLITEYAKNGSINLYQFYARRFLRLYPELIALILLCLASFYFLPLTASPAEKMAGLLYYMNYYYVFGSHYFEINSVPWRQLWSLSVEEHFYLLFPGLLLVCRTRRARLILVSMLISVPFFWRFVTYYGLGLPWQYNYVATDTRIDSIAWGCLLALLLHRSDGARISAAKLRFINVWAVPTALAIIGATLLYRNEGFRWTWRFSAQGIGIVLLMANLLFDARWRSIVALLEAPPVRFFGRISYGLYLYHMLINRCLEEVLPTMPRSAFAAVSIVSAFLIAALSYRLLEVPLKSVRRRLGSHTR